MNRIAHVTLVPSFVLLALAGSGWCADSDDLHAAKPTTAEKPAASDKESAEKKEAEEKLKALLQQEKKLQDKLRKVGAASPDKPEKDW